MFCFLASHVHVSCLIEATIHDDLTIYIGMTPEMFKCFWKKLYMKYKRSILKENTPIKNITIPYPIYCSLTNSSKSFFFKYDSGAKYVTVTTPGCRPISIEPLIVARFITSGTVMSKNFDALSIPLFVASFRSAPDPTNETG